MKHPLKWKKIPLSTIDPSKYPTLYKRSPIFSTIVEGHVFYSNNPVADCEIFYEKIDDGCWLMAMEIHSKSNNHYVVHSKRTEKDHCSINIFSNPKNKAMLADGDFRGPDDYVRFIAPGMDFEFYQQEGTILKLCRLIFSQGYLGKLISFEEIFSAEPEASDLSQFYGKLNINRRAASVEILTQSRLLNLLRYERGTHHFRPSIYSDFFQLAAFFLNYRDCREQRKS